MSSELLKLVSAHASGRTQLVIDPVAGASIIEYSSFDGSRKADWLQPRDSGTGGSFAMVPFCSRIHHGKFRFGGRQVTLPPNLPNEPHAIHGHGFQQAWAVDSATSESAELTYTHESGAWPWSYRCKQRLWLEGEKLSITLELSNLSDTPMPYGLGLHPYFPKNQALTLTAQVATHLRLDDRLLPAELEPLPLDLQLPDGLGLTDQSLDNVFCNWQRAVQITWPHLRRGLLLEASAGCNHLVVWVPQGRDFCCIEPVSNLPDGFNLGASFPDAFSVLRAGEDCTMTFSFTPVHH